MNLIFQNGTNLRITVISRVKKTAALFANIRFQRTILTFSSRAITAMVNIDTGMKLEQKDVKMILFPNCAIAVTISDIHIIIINR